MVFVVTFLYLEVHKKYLQMKWNYYILGLLQNYRTAKNVPHKNIIYEKSNNVSGREADDGCWTWWWAHSCLVASVVSNSGGIYGL